MAYHPRATPNFRNLVVRPMWITLRAALRTIPVIGPKFFSSGYHGKEAEMLDEKSANRIKDDDSDSRLYAADRETSHFVKSLSRPVTVMYPYERLEDLEPWLFVPNNYNGRIGVVWETCTACKACVRACPNDCLHMESEVRVNVLDMPDASDENLGLSTVEFMEGGYLAQKKDDFEDIENTFSLETAHESAPQQYDFAEIIDLNGNTASVRWQDTGKIESVDLDGMIPAEQDIVSGRIDLGRCMFCGLCMESCPFNSFFMTNEYDGMSGMTRNDLWMDASRTRVLPVVHKEAVDRELAKRADKERSKRERAAKKASKAKQQAEDTPENAEAEA